VWGEKKWKGGERSHNVLDLAQYKKGECLLPAACCSGVSVEFHLLRYDEKVRAIS
jgi:hypothetical protein